MADSDLAAIQRIAKTEKKMKIEMGEKKANIVKKVVEEMNVLWVMINKYQFNKVIVIN